MQNAGAIAGNTAIGTDAVKVDYRQKSLEKSKKKSRKSGDKISQLLSFDEEMRRKWLKNPAAPLVGTDEVGRGCLAGPVVAACVQIPDEKTEAELVEIFAGLNDSKKLSAPKREELAAQIREHCLFEIAEASVEEIDRLNILQASFLAMRRALAKLSLKDSAVILVDGNQKIRELALRQILVVGGDGISASIAAASIVAKVYRDNLMQRLHEEFPPYGWDSNKGYGSETHRDAIIQYGLTPYHRPSFCRNFNSEQLSLL